MKIETIIVNAKISGPRLSEPQHARTQMGIGSHPVPQRIRRRSGSESRDPGAALRFAWAAVALLAVASCGELFGQQTQDLPFTSASTGADGPLTFRQILYGGRY